MYCPQCGKIIAKNEKYCVVCGKSLKGLRASYNLNKVFKSRNSIVVLISSIILILFASIIITTVINNHKENTSSAPAIQGDVSSEPSIINNEKSSKELNNESNITKSWADETVQNIVQEMLEYEIGVSEDSQIFPQNGSDMDFLYTLDLYGRPDTRTQINFGVNSPISYFRYDMKGNLLAEIYYKTNQDLDIEESHQYIYDNASSELRDSLESPKLSIPYSYITNYGLSYANKNSVTRGIFYLDSFYEKYLETNNASSEDALSPNHSFTGQQYVDSAIKRILDNEENLIKEGWQYEIVLCNESNTPSSCYAILTFSDSSGEEYVYEVAQNGQIISYIGINEDYMDNITRAIINKFDNLGRIVRTDFYINFLDSGSAVFEKSYFHSINDYSSPYYTYKYDKVGHMINLTAHYQGGAVYEDFCWQRKYDANGNLIYKETTDMGPITTQWEFDNNSVLLSETKTWLYGGSENYFRQAAYEYDKDGNICLIAQYKSEGDDLSNKWLESIKSFIKGDDNTVIVKVTKYNGAVIISEKEIKYSPSGEIVSAIDRNFSENTFTRIDYEYNSNMEVQSITSYDQEGAVIGFLSLMK